MSHLLHISEAASLGLHVASLMATVGDKYLPARELAERLGASEAHLAKVMQRLVKAGLVSSTRGPRGGFKLRRLPGDISQLEVYEAVEGQVEEARCLLGKEACVGACIFDDFVHRIDSEFREYLATTTLDKLSVKEFRNGHPPDYPRR